LPSRWTTLLQINKISARSDLFVSGEEVYHKRSPKKLIQTPTFPAGIAAELE
jgi:hypothetical protein